MDNKQWDLTHYYATYEDFKKDLDDFDVFVEECKKYEGKLSNEKDFVAYFRLQRQMLERFLRPYIYVHSKMDMDQRNMDSVSDMQNVMYKMSMFDQATAFESPELLSLDESYIFGILDKYKEFEPLRYNLTNLLRSKEHEPGLEGKRIMANFQQLGNAGNETFNALSTADAKFNKIMLDGKEVEINHSNWTTLIGKAKTEEDRKNIFEALFSIYEDTKNTYAAIYNAVLQADIANAKSKKFDSALEMHLFYNNIPTSLYHNLIATAHKLAPLAKEYYALRKDVLKLSKYHTYDRFLDLAESDNKTYTYEDARELFFESIDKFDDEFKSFAREVSAEGWVDVYPRPGKRTGAYSNSVPGVHPAILLNFNGTLDDCFTFAHESGHSIHTMFSEKYQPLETESYTIFVAEIASTFNEHNLLDYLLNKGTLSKNEKINLIQNAIDSIMSTFYRQTLFAEYEYIAHTKAEKGEPITSESLSNIMIDLYNTYYGLDLNDEVYKKYVWAYIPHFFHSPYYVYQYATSFSASLAIYEKVKNNEPNAFENYKEMLKSGGSDYPINIVKKAGVDFTKLDAIEGVVTRYATLLEELKKALSE